MTNNFKGGIHNPLACTNSHAKFQFEVLDLDEVKYFTESDGGDSYKVPERKMLLGSLSGGNQWAQQKYLCIASLRDATKPLRVGELISAKLKFEVVDDADGCYEQRIYASNIYTLSDYREIREAEARYQGKLDKKD